MKKFILLILIVGIVVLITGCPDLTGNTSSATTPTVTTYGYIVFDNDSDSTGEYYNLTTYIDDIRWTGSVYNYTPYGWTLTCYVSTGTHKVNFRYYNSSTGIEGVIYSGKTVTVYEGFTTTYMWSHRF